MTINETGNFLHICDLSNKAPLIEGLHGTGKSEIIRQYAAEHDLHCETLILSLMDPSDLLGMPRTADIGGQLSTLWAAPIWYQRIVDAAWPAELNVEDLKFNDSAFEAYVLSKL